MESTNKKWTLLYKANVEDKCYGVLERNDKKEWVVALNPIEKENVGYVWDSGDYFTSYNGAYPDVDMRNRAFDYLLYIIGKRKEPHFRTAYVEGKYKLTHEETLNYLHNMIDFLVASEWTKEDIARELGIENEEVLKELNLYTPKYRRVYVLATKTVTQELEIAVPENWNKGDIESELDCWDLCEDDGGCNNQTEWSYDICKEEVISEEDAERYGDYFVKGDD